MEKCSHPGCDYSAKTKGAVTAHVRKVHGEDPMTAIRNAMGAGAPRPGGAFRTDRPLTAAPSGVPSVDFAIGIGGVPRGTIIEVFGPGASGKTFMALTFSAYAQSQGEKAGYMDAERALQPTFAMLVPGLDLNALEYGTPPGVFGQDKEPFDGTGESALEASRRYIASGQYAVWTVDSVHACKPREAMSLPIGDKRASAALARLFNDALGIMEADISRTDTVAVFVNHVKAVPNVKFGRDWSKPGGTAFDYYASVQLHVTSGTQFFNKEGRRIGHEVRVKVHKSKVAAPHAKAAYNLFYAKDRVVPQKNQSGVVERDVEPGVDIASCWFSVCQEAGLIAVAGSTYVDADTGETLGSRQDVHGVLSDPGSALLTRAQALVYPKEYNTPKLAVVS